MTKKLIVANWKMNPANRKEARRLFRAVKKGVKKTKNAEVVACLPFVYLPMLKGLSLGAQDIFYEKQGAFTGEVSPLMLTDLEVKYVIVGHSERRMYFGETDEIINKKIKAALSAKLKPIFCVGESIGEDKAIILEKQITKGLKSISNATLRGVRLASSKFQISNLIIAYEPVWAIGTGNNCSVDETMSSMLLIRKIISKLYGKKSASAAKVIYGGSVDSENADSYLHETGIDGLLVGVASLDAEEFIKIVSSA